MTLPPVLSQRPIIIRDIFSTWNTILLAKKFQYHHYLIFNRNILHYKLQCIFLVGHKLLPIDNIFIIVSTWWLLRKHFKNEHTFCVNIQILFHLKTSYNCTLLYSFPKSLHAQNLVPFLLTVSTSWKHWKYMKQTQ